MPASRYRTLRAVSSLAESFGWLIVVAFFAIGLYVGSKPSFWGPGSLVQGAIYGLGVGLTFGVGFILYGQLMALLVEMRDLLARMVNDMSGSAPTTTVAAPGYVDGADLHASGAHGPAGGPKTYRCGRCEQRSTNRVEIWNHLRVSHGVERFEINDHIVEEPT